MHCIQAVKKPLAHAAVAMLSLAAAQQALAASHSLTLTGLVANGFPFTQIIPPTRFDQYQLPLGGVGSFGLANGDSVSATLTLDMPLTIPASVDLTSVALILQGSGFVSGSSVETGPATVVFSNLGSPMPAIIGPGASTSGQVAAAITLFPPDNGALSFDQMTISFDVMALAGPVTINSAMLTYTLFSPAVPEPATYGLMLLGLGAVAGVARRRRPNGAH